MMSPVSNGKQRQVYFLIFSCVRELLSESIGVESYSNWALHPKTV